MDQLPVSMFTPSTVVAAVKELGWAGDVVGPVAFGGVRFWAVADVDDASTVRLVGCLFAGAPPGVVRAASLLAAYTPRAVLVDDAQDLTAVLVDAAVLDQGVVAVGSAGVRVLSFAGPRVFNGPVSAREQTLLDEVFKVWQATHLAAVC